RCGVTPESGEVPSEAAHPGDLLIAQFLLASSRLSIVVLLGGGDASEPLVPLRLQGIGNEAVRGIDRHVATPGQIGLVACPLHMLASKAIGLLRPVVELLLDRQ